MDEPVVAIRTAVPADAARLTEIAHAAKRHWGYPESWIERWSAALTIGPEEIRRGEFLVAVVADRIVGFGGVEIDGDEATVEHLWVLPSCMRQGVGRRLFKELESFARRRGTRALVIESDPSAAPFYARMGAIEVARKAAPMDGTERYLPILRKPL